ncbi:hypothetical protein [Oxalobacter paraformigenes]|uniref:hypothetical protein n=1 Tax=Oxalobacter paraformigenes TaxID=556268 RepID=UPI001C9C1ED5|nr:hypothetical protein [Oxalobacter paraformigenes]
MFWNLQNHGFRQRIEQEGEAQKASTGFYDSLPVVVLCSWRVFLFRALEILNGLCLRFWKRVWKIRIIVIDIDGLANEMRY